MRGRSVLFLATLAARLVISPLSAQTYTLLTYNIRYDNQHDGRDLWEFRKEAVAREVLRHGPVIIGLQEVLRNQLADLRAQWPGYAHFGVGRDDGKESGEFAPVFFDTATFALLDGRTIWLSPTPMEPSMGWDATCRRIVTLVILRDRSTGDSLWVANTHWDHVGKEARNQSSRIVRDLLAPVLARGKRAIFMGDLNAAAGQEPIHYLGEHFTDACPKNRRCRGTFNGFKKLRLLSRRIDYIWLSPGNWTVEQYEVTHPHVKCRQVSDHFPVAVRVLLK